MAINQTVLKGWGPGGWIFFQPETNWHAPGPLQHNFDAQVKNIIAMRKANPRFNLPTDEATVAAELEAFTEHRWAQTYSRRGIAKFLAPEPESEESKKKESSFMRSGKSLLNATAGLAGVDPAPLADWLGYGGVPVPPETAEARAKVCQSCRANEKTGWLALLTAVAARRIRSYLAKKHALNLTTPLDAELGLCAACKCSLELKVWCDGRFISDNQTPEDLVKLAEANPNCWALNP